MWKCTECKSQMEDDVLNCIDCGSPKPKSFGLEIVKETVEDKSTESKKKDNKIKKSKEDKKTRDGYISRREKILVNDDLYSGWVGESASLCSF